MRRALSKNIKTMKNFAKSTFSIIKTIIFTALLACIAIFMINNRQMVTVEMFPLPILIETRLFMLMALCFALGILIGFFIFTTNHLKGLFFSSKNDKNQEIAQKSEKNS